MKTKNKILASLEIAIVLCSVFWVAIPAIAADQTTQKTSANMVPTASEDDYVLGIYGNANEDDTIDMRDLTYVKLIFFGKKPETELADAKYDGKINPLDFIQIKLIIVGKEKELTIVDSADRIVTIKKPVERVVTSSFGYGAEVIRMFGEKDKIVGVSNYIVKQKDYFPELSKLPDVGSWTLDYEAILSCNPDLVVASTYKTAECAEKLPGIPVVGFSFYYPETLKEEVMKLGYIFGKKDEAKYYVNEFHEGYIDLIKARTEGLSEEERPKVYVETTKAYQTYGGKSYVQQAIDIAGGKYIFADLPGASFVNVDPEEVVMRNPSIIIRYISYYYGTAGYQLDDPSGAKAIWDEIMSRPELADVSAVKDEHVYLIDKGLNTGPDYPIALAYWAKGIHPELFEDLDPQAIHQEWLTEFQGLDFDVSKRGVFVYHPELYPDGR